jgi:hypothetical protein
MQNKKIIITVKNETSSPWNYVNDALKHGKWSDGKAPASLAPGITELSSEKGTGTSYGTDGWVEYQQNGSGVLTINWSKPYGKGTSTCTAKMSKGSKCIATVSDMVPQPELTQCTVTITPI